MASTMFKIINIILLVFIIDSVITKPLERFQNKSIKVKRDLNAIQEKLKQTLNPQPILDTISQAEMCCNNVQHVIGKKVSETYDQISQVLNNVLLQLPQQKISLIGKSVTDILDKIGGKLVGLTK
uniref:Uncharacterized protein n=1 Tax=Pristhesancus plagipennis TaxID=1955184 RepID=A0A2K8JSK8_PRIPG|nr:secreted hypothetical protein [Pristhesancus plagipennis]